MILVLPLDEVKCHPLLRNRANFSHTFQLHLIKSWQH